MITDRRTPRIRGCAPSSGVCGRCLAVRRLRALLYSTMLMEPDLGWRTSRIRGCAPSPSGVCGRCLFVRRLRALLSSMMQVEWPAARS